MLSEEKIREKLDTYANYKSNLKIDLQSATLGSEREYIKDEMLICDSKIDILREILNG